MDNMGWIINDLCRREGGSLLSCGYIRTHFIYNRTHHAKAFTPHRSGCPDSLSPVLGLLHLYPPRLQINGCVPHPLERRYSLCSSRPIDVREEVDDSTRYFSFTAESDRLEHREYRRSRGCGTHPCNCTQMMGMVVRPHTGPREAGRSDR